QRLPRHDLTDPDHGVDQEVEVRVEARRPVQLEIGEWPFLVEHADRSLAETLDGPGLCACRHGGNEDVVAIGRVVDDRHRRWALLALKGEDAGAVLAHEGASLLRVHPYVLRLFSTRPPIQ